MLLFFRNNQFATAIPLALYVGLTHLAAFAGTVQPGAATHSNEGLLFQALFGRLGALPLLSALAAAVLVWLQALQINRLADEFRLLSDRNWLPGLCYALAAACLPGFLFLSAPLVAATFVPIAARRIFLSYQKSNGAAYVLDAALWTAVASLFYPPMIALLAAAAAGVWTMRTFSFREQWVFVTGALVPLALAWIGFFWADRGMAFLDGQFGHLFGLCHFPQPLDMRTGLKGAILAAVLLFVLFNSGRFYARKLIQAQKCITVLYWFMAVAGLAALFQTDLSESHFVLLMPSAAVFLAIVISAMRNRMMAEIAHVLLLGSVLFVQYLPG